MTSNRSIITTAECESHQADIQKKEHDQKDKGVEEIVVDAYDRHKLLFYTVYCEQLRNCVEDLEHNMNTVLICFNSAKYDFTLISYCFRFMMKRKCVLSSRDQPTEWWQYVIT